MNGAVQYQSEDAIWFRCWQIINSVGSVIDICVTNYMNDLVICFCHKFLLPLNMQKDRTVKHLIGTSTPSQWIGFVPF